MSDIHFLGIKLSDTECISLGLFQGASWCLYTLNPDYHYKNLIWINAPSHKEQALLLLSLGLGKQEIEEHFNIGK